VKKKNAPLAQSVEQLPLKQTVVGSNPSRRTRMNSVLVWGENPGGCTKKRLLEKEFILMAVIVQR
jgi:hypothetical protein